MTFTDVCVCQAFVCVLLISPSLLFPWQHGRTGIDWQGSSKGSLATCSLFQAPPCWSLFCHSPRDISDLLLLLILTFSSLSLYICICMNLVFGVCRIKPWQLLRFSHFFWLPLTSVTLIGNSYCMFALLVWAGGEWISVLWDALYIKWLIWIDSPLFRKRVTEGERHGNRRQSADVL